jgi:hypothetical protein
MEDLTAREQEILARLAILEATRLDTMIDVVDLAQQKRVYREKKNEMLEIVRKLMSKDLTDKKVI